MMMLKIENIYWVVILLKNIFFNICQVNESFIVIDGKHGSVCDISFIYDHLNLYLTHSSLL